MDVINIGSGYQPISKADLDDCPLFINKVVNYDPLPDSRLTTRYLQLVDMIRLVKEVNEDLYLARTPDELNRLCFDGQTDLVIAISPYNFTVIDKYIDAKIAQWGYVIIFGNTKNPFIQPERSFSDGLHQKYAPLELTDPIAGYVQRAIGKIKQNYQSYTTNLEKVTSFKDCNAYQKTQF
jgi:hypothetical protein